MYLSCKNIDSWGANREFLVIIDETGSFGVFSDKRMLAMMSLDPVFINWLNNLSGCDFKRLDKWYLLFEALGAARIALELIESESVIKPIRLSDCFSLREKTITSLTPLKNFSSRVIKPKAEKIDISQFFVLICL